MRLVFSETKEPEVSVLGRFFLKMEPDGKLRRFCLHSQARRNMCENPDSHEKKDEDAIKNILATAATNEYAKDEYSAWIAKNCFKKNHLYENLGFENRAMLASFMYVNFLALAQKKPDGMRWKKFLHILIDKVPQECEQCDERAECEGS